MQEKKKSTKKFREREREREGERGNHFFFVRENYAYDKRDSDKFIVKGCE